MDADAVINPHISLGVSGGADPTVATTKDRRKDEDYVKTNVDAMDCLELECNQTFLGMIQLQYQPVVEFVQLVDLLEKACIRYSFIMVLSKP